MTEQLKKQIEQLSLSCTISEEEINGKKYTLISITTLVGQRVWGLVDPDTLKIYKGLGKSSYKERFFAAICLSDLEAHAKKDIKEISKLFPTAEEVTEIRDDFISFMHHNN